MTTQPRAKGESGRGRQVVGLQVRFLFLCVPIQSPIQTLVQLEPCAISVQGAAEKPEPQARGFIKPEGGSEGSGPPDAFS